MRKPNASFWSGKRVWIVGASSGIGRAFAETVAGVGASVVLSSRSIETLESLAQAARRRGQQVTVVPVDVTDGASVSSATKRVLANDSAVDLLFYSAGAWTVTDAPEIVPEHFERQTQVNYLGLVRCVGEVLPSMISRRKGVIAGVSSASAYSPLPRAEAYGASKAAVTYFLQSLRTDVRRHGVRIVTVTPGFVDTPLTERNDFPMPFMVSPEAAAALIAAGLEDDATEVHFPRRLTVPLKLLGALPRPVNEWTTRQIFKR